MLPEKSLLPALSHTPTKSSTLAIVLSIVLIFALFLALGIWWCLFFVRNYPYPPPSQPKPIDSTLNGRDLPNTYTYPIYSPRRFYEALRSLTHSPGREYPVEPMEEIEQTQRQEAGLGTPVSAISCSFLRMREAVVKVGQNHPENRRVVKNGRTQYHWLTSPPCEDDGLWFIVHHSTRWLWTNTFEQ